MIHTALPVLTDALPAARARALQEEVRRLAREREAVTLADN